MHRRKQMMASPTCNDQTTIISTEIPKISKGVPILKFDQKLAIFIGNKYTETIIISLILVYSTIVTIRIAFDTELSSVSMPLDILEITILSLFVFEISVKIIVLKTVYFQSWLNILDILIIILCFIVIGIDMADSQRVSSPVYKIAKIMRIARLIIMFRRITEQRVGSVRKSFRRYAVVSVSSPSDTVLAVLNKFMDYEWVAINESLREELVWCYEMIRTRKLYDVNIIADSTENNDIVKMGLEEEEFQEVKEGTYSVVTTNLPMVSIENSMVNAFSNCEDWDFDIFKAQNEVMSSILELLTGHILTAFNLFSALDIRHSNFSEFIREIAGGYIKENPYHNSLHAADVVQAFYYLLTTCNARKICEFQDLDIFVCIISAAIHDFQHPGLNNLYLINSCDKLATRYNDKSVLENHHLAAAFEVMQAEQKNVFTNWTKEMFRKARVKMINLVLAIDFSRHFADINRFQTKFSNGKIEDEESRGLSMEMMMHASDISNPTRPWDLCYAWADKVMNEFFQQGDREREMGLPISQLCDRLTVSIPKAQIGFMDLFIEPTFTALLLIIPKADKNLEILKQNKRMWNEKKD